MERDWPGVFVSSTCLDLIDLRAELEPFLRELGFLPMLSDRPSSSFEVAGDRDAVATCLENVKHASRFVCVVPQKPFETTIAVSYSTLSGDMLVQEYSFHFESLAASSIRQIARKLLDVRAFLIE